MPTFSITERISISVNKKDAWNSVQHSFKWDFLNQFFLTSSWFKRCLNICTVLHWLKLTTKYSIFILIKTLAHSAPDILIFMLEPFLHTVFYRSHQKVDRIQGRSLKFAWYFMEIVAHFYSKSYSMAQKRSKNFAPPSMQYAMTS